MTEVHDTKRSVIRAPEVAAGALAAATGAFVGSRLGLTGTATGAGIVSVISSICAVVYEYSLERTGRTVLKGLNQPLPHRSPALPEQANRFVRVHQEGVSHRTMVDGRDTAPVAAQGN
jgi:hypothetical protein